MPDTNTYELKVSDYFDFGDVAIITGAGFLKETCAKCGKEKVWLLSGGYVWNSTMQPRFIKKDFIKL